MKLLLVGMILSLFVVTGCGSKKKEAETTMADKAEQMESKSEEMVEEAEEQAEEMVESAEEKVEEMTSKSASSFNCSLGSDERMIEIVAGENPKCEVFYAKNGERLSIARANWDASYCDKVAGQVKGNLENAGYSCN